jgi:hypothetical protein
MKKIIKHFITNICKMAMLLFSRLHIFIINCNIESGGAAVTYQIATNLIQNYNNYTKFNYLYKYMIFH